MADNQGLKPIYIEQLFRSKNPGVAKMIPGFIYSYLKKVIHQDDINDFITRYGDRKGLDFSDAILEYLHVSYQVIGEANLPSPDGRKHDHLTVGSISVFQCRNGVFRLGTMLVDR